MKPILLMPFSSIHSLVLFLSAEKKKTPKAWRFCKARQKTEYNQHSGWQRRWPIIASWTPLPDWRGREGIGWESFCRVAPMLWYAHPVYIYLDGEPLPSAHAPIVCIVPVLGGPSLLFCVHLGLFCSWSYCCCWKVSIKLSKDFFFQKCALSQFKSHNSILEEYSQGPGKDISFFCSFYKHRQSICKTVNKIFMFVDIRNVIASSKAA